MIREWQYQDNIVLTRQILVGAYIFEFYETRHVLPSGANILFDEIQQLNELEYSVSRIKALDNIFSGRVRRGKNSECRNPKKGLRGQDPEIHHVWRGIAPECALPL
jgi:hypothetical protein